MSSITRFGGGGGQESDVYTGSSPGVSSRDRSGSSSSSGRSRSSSADKENVGATLPGTNTEGMSLLRNLKGALGGHDIGYSEMQAKIAEKMQSRTSKVFIFLNSLTADQRTTLAGAIGAMHEDSLQTKDNKRPSHEIVFYPAGHFANEGKKAEESMKQVFTTLFSGQDKLDTKYGPIDRMKANANLSELQKQGILPLGIKV